jgi:hypothetical protein
MTPYDPVDVQCRFEGTFDIDIQSGLEERVLRNDDKHLPDYMASHHISQSSSQSKPREPQISSLIIPSSVICHLACPPPSQIGINLELWCLQQTVGRTVFSGDQSCRKAATYTGQQ